MERKVMIAACTISICCSCVASAQAPAPEPKTEVKCGTTGESHVLDSKWVDEGIVDGHHMLRYVPTRTVEESHVVCRVQIAEQQVFEHELPLPQPNTKKERDEAVQKFLKVWFKSGLSGIKKAYGLVKSGGEKK